MPKQGAPGWRRRQGFQILGPSSRPELLEAGTPSSVGERSPRKVKEPPGGEGHRGCGHLRWASRAVRRRWGSRGSQTSGFSAAFGLRQRPCSDQWGRAAGARGSKSGGRDAGDCGGGRGDN